MGGARFHSRGNITVAGILTREGRIQKLATHSLSTVVEIAKVSNSHSSAVGADGRKSGLFFALRKCFSRSLEFSAIPTVAYRWAGNHRFPMIEPMTLQYPFLPPID